MRNALVAEVTSGIIVGQLEADTQTLVHIYGEPRVEPVFTVLLITAVVVCQVGERREGVGKQKLVRFHHKERVGVGEDKRAALFAVDEDTVLAGGVVVADGVVLAIDTRIEDGVLEQVAQRVWRCGNHVTEFTVYGPHFQTLGYFLVLRGGVVVVLVEILASLRHVASLVNLLIGVLCHQRSDGQHRE